MNTLKRYFILFLGLLIITACSKDNDPGTDPDPIDRSANLLGTGDSANDILTNTTFDRLLLEIGYVTGFRPTQEAVNNLLAFLQARTFKQNIQIQYLELPSPNQSDLSLQEVADLERDNRTAYNEGSTLAIYIYFADAPSENDDPQEGTVTLGAVYRNTSMVVHEVTVRQLAQKSSQITTEDIETATLTHEFGHLLGLVDLGTTPVNPSHEDPSAVHHCITDGCLMRAEIEFGGGMLKAMNKLALAGKSAVPVLDAECIADLQANGGR